MSGDRRETPYGNTEKFVQAVMQSHGAAFVASWLVGGLNCQFTFDTIYTTSLGRERLLSTCYEHAYNNRVRIRQCNKVRDHFYDERDRIEGRKLTTRSSSEPPTMNAGAKQQHFRSIMEKILRPSLFEAIFDTSQIRYQGDDVMLVRAPIWKRVLQRDGEEALRHLGLKVRFCPRTFLDEQDTTRDATDDERAHVGRLLRDLAKSLRSDSKKQATQTLAQRVAARAKP